MGAPQEKRLLLSLLGLLGVAHLGSKVVCMCECVLSGRLQGLGERLEVGLCGREGCGRES